MDDLNGLHIVVTRPRAQAEPWALRLQALGAKVSLISLMDIAAVQSEQQILAIKNHILNFDHYQKAIFVSQNAVQFGLEWIDSYWPQLPSVVSFFAVGETTANLLQSLGARVSDLAQTQTGAMTSETLLQSSSLQHVAGEKILIFRGCGGRTYLGDTLSARGAQVHYCELYERKLPENAAKQLAQLWQGDKANTAADNIVMTLHSGEALANLCEITQQLLSTEQKKMQQVKILVPSSRVAEQAADAGFDRVFVAENATEASMLQRLLDIKASLEN